MCIWKILALGTSVQDLLRHAGVEAAEPWNRLPVPARSDLDHRLRRCLVEGGFPEAQGIDARDRHILLRSYADVVVLRDVIERHAVSNPLPLRWMQRQLLSNPAGLFSVHKFHGALKSQGVGVSKDTLHEYLTHLEDAFLIRTLSLHTSSERQRMVNPRKAYPVDPGLIPIYERSGRANWGHPLETAAFLKLERRGYEMGYVRTPQGSEVDFLARSPGEPPLLVQVCSDVQDPQTYDREVRALAAAAGENGKIGHGAATRLPCANRLPSIDYEL
jgi:predicted AAA+ superfamily ATPase